MSGYFYRRVSSRFVQRYWDLRLCSRTGFSFILPLLIKKKKPNEHMHGQQLPGLLVQIQLRQTGSHPSFSVASAVTNISIRTMEVSMLDQICGPFERVNYFEVLQKQMEKNSNRTSAVLTNQSSYFVCVLCLYPGTAVGQKDNI